MLDEMTEDHPRRRIALLAQELEEHRHRVQHSGAARRHVSGTPDVHRASAVTRQVGGPQQSSSDAGCEEFTIPAPVVRSRNMAGLLAIQDFLDFRLWASGR
jgi:hypothetical protein